MAESKIFNITNHTPANWKNRPDGSPQSDDTGSLSSVMANTERCLDYSEARTTTLTISKSVTGDCGDRAREFTFTAYFEDSGGQALAAGTSFNYTASILQSIGAIASSSGTLTLDWDGKAAFTVKHGQSITIEGVAVDGRIRLIENMVPIYAASFTDSEDTFSNDGGDTRM